MKRTSNRTLEYSMTLKHWYQILVETFLHWRSHPSLETWRRFKEQCARSKVISCRWFFIEKNVIELSEWLHESYLNNNEYIYKLKTQNEKLLEKLQDTCSSSYVSDCHVVDLLENSHDMMDHERHGKLGVLDVFEDDIDDLQSRVVVEE